MTQHKIFIQSWWVSPGGGKVGIITTPDQFKWYVYDTSLFQFMKAGSEITANVDADKKNQKGEPRPTVLSLVGEEPPVQSATIPEVGKIIPKTEPHPQAVGMITKELGDMIRTQNLKTLFGEEIAFELVKWYRAQVLGITKVSFDGAKLPKFGKGTLPPDSVGRREGQ